MLRLYAIACLLALVTFDANTALAQRVFRTPAPTPMPRLHVPPVPLSMPTLDDRLTLPVPTPVVPAPPRRAQPAPPDAGMCCPCPDTNECSDVCCLRQ